jgi:hypothetical protein
MHPPDALQVLLIAHAKDARSGNFPKPENYVDAIRAAFTPWEAEEQARSATLAEGERTGASVKWYFVDGMGKRPQLPPGAADLNKALHSLVIIFVTSALVKDAVCVRRLEEIAVAIRSANGSPHGLLPLGTNEAVLAELRAHPRAKVLNETQGKSLESLAEYAIRPDYAAMLALHRAHLLLTSYPGKKSSAATAKACFFISHAKLDGLPLAASLREAIKSLPWLDSFYDARDIQPGDDWERGLEDGVQDSMLLALRTDSYDQRFWCRREVMWAERYDRPVLLIDARTLLLARPSVLGFTGVPGVRIPDGNLVRVLAEALREWVRIGVFRGRCTAAIAGNASLAKRTEFLSRPPTVESLDGALERLQARAAPKNALIVHPDPALEGSNGTAVQTLMRSRFAKGTVLSLRSFLAQLP